MRQACSRLAARLRLWWALWPLTSPSALTGARLALAHLGEDLAVSPAQIEALRAEAVVWTMRWCETHAVTASRRQIRGSVALALILGRS